MAAINDSRGPPRWLERLRRLRLVLATAAIVFAGLWAIGALAAAPALLGFALIALAAMVASGRVEATPAAVPKDRPAAPRVGDPLIEAVLAGLPDPVVALDQRDDVVALNARASAVAPAIRRGEPISLGLRVPEVLDAIRRARASAAAQRAEFFQRVPLDRWYEAIVTPITSAGGEPGLLLLAFHDLTPLRPDKELDLAAVLRQVADGLQPLARDREVEVKLTAPAGPLMVPGDRDELIRVFENLVENALKYAASGRRVDIALSRGEGPDGKAEARIAVRDRGPGIAPEHLPRLTERFYRVDVSESRAQGGTGLGLALVKHILNRHGGRLTIDSLPGQGATFTAHLPLPGAPAKGN